MRCKFTYSCGRKFVPKNLLQPLNRRVIFSLSLRANGTLIVNNHRLSIIILRAKHFFFLLARKEKRSATHVKWLLKTDNSLQKECLWHTQEKRNPQVSELCTSFEFNYEAMPHTSQRLVFAPVRVL